jgi:hypothetical protein
MIDAYDMTNLLSIECLELHNLRAEGDDLHSHSRPSLSPFVCLAAHETRASAVDDCRKCHTSTVTPAEPGEPPIGG